MRTLVVVLALILIATGLWLAFWPAAKVTEDYIALWHIWGGFFFVVLFPMYSWDHIMARRKWLGRFRVVTLSGILQLVAAAVLIITGVLIWLYQGQVWQWVLEWHHWLTYVLAAALAGHYLAPKKP